MNKIPILVWVFLALLIVWLVMINALWKRLRTRHPDKYRIMGEPKMFPKNSFKCGLTTIKFLFLREHKELNDKSLSLLSDSMLLLLAVYIILLLVDFAYVSIYFQP